MPANPTGASSGIQVVGLKEFRKALAMLDGNWPAAMSLAHQKIASRGAAYARAQARGMGGVQAKSASAIGERHSERDARVAVLPSKYLDPMANVAFWGAKRHTGWYARLRYSNSTPQHPKWVGASWEPMVAGQGPYAINEALAYRKEELLDEYFEAIDGIAQRAFPDGG